MPEVFDILWGTPITSHAWNRDRSQVAVVPNNNEVHIYGQRGSEWVVLHVLKEHDKLITSVDWAPNSNRIVTCSQDRNAYVWSWDTATSSWKPTLVLLRINRAATFVQWSPAENKFAVGSGARMICVCYFEEENDWWVAKHIKSPIRSTVLSLQWHPDNIHLAVGCADMTARVFSTIVKGIDSVSAPSVWGGKSKFGTLVSEYKSPASGWVHSVAFSPSGNVLAFAGHDSSLNISYGPQEGIVSINTNHLPLVSILFISENYIVGCGHDCVPYLYSNRGGNWELVDKLDQGKKRPSATSSGILSSRFLAMDTRGQASTEVELNSNHQNTIKTTRVYEATGNAVTKFSTTSLDGKLIIWDILASGLAKVQL
ncbi:WD40-repeat-containing domain protein [Polychytrium aggregatum]|uniref:WD40-repeat-containing domain protein n=1 Tax=Polychytrium aggregatum TaxID=110093 RepID=UPI0022FEB89B|nr:WD40-repeat-containing domain protein [Polychytrium aggregatum]KAI9207961.1 WD40-repeat-containing domain protein [Polychytrium aggregatum]